MAKIIQGSAMVSYWYQLTVILYGDTWFIIRSYLSFKFLQLHVSYMFIETPQKLEVKLMVRTSLKIYRKLDYDKNKMQLSLSSNPHQVASLVS